MARPRVYVETTIPSSYHDDRADLDSAARRLWTRRWWHGPAADYELVTSLAVLNELRAAPEDRARPRLELLVGVPLVSSNAEVDAIVAEYIRRKLMPAGPNGDARHVALASFHRCDYLVTWNCRHLANVNKTAHLRRVNLQLGLFIPTLVTPQLLGADNGESAV